MMRVLHSSWKFTPLGWEISYPSCNAGDSFETVGAFFAGEGGQALEQVARRGCGIFTVERFLRGAGIAHSNSI